MVSDDSGATVQSDKAEGQDAASSAVPPRKRMSRRVKVWIIAGVAFLVFYTIPAAFTANPRACATCHAMRPYYETWSTSRHRGAAYTCLHCHAKPGVINRAIYRATIYKDIVIVITGGRVTLFRTSEVTNESCQQSGCHSLNRVFSLSGQIRVNHRVHVEGEGMSCMDCHQGAGHEGVRGTSVPPMDSCAECHEAVMDDCAYCHMARSLPTRDDS
ncbi:MAG: NapC/NirT family cytochrome c [Clostridiales bacterium]|nr:NapC/NirT family cytochrome c [Clostridiales bacterium]